MYMYYILVRVINIGEKVMSVVIIVDWERKEGKDLAYPWILNNRQPHIATLPVIISMRYFLFRVAKQI